MYVTSDFSDAYRRILAAVYGGKTCRSLASVHVALEVAENVLAESGIRDAEPKDLCTERCLALINGGDWQFDEEIVMRYSRNLRQYWSQAASQSLDSADWTIDSGLLALKLFEPVKLPATDEENGEFGFVSRWDSERGLSCKTYIFGRRKDGFKLDANFHIGEGDQSIADFTASFLLSRPPWRPSELSKFLDWDSISREVFTLDDVVRSVSGTA